MSTKVKKPTKKRYEILASDGRTWVRCLNAKEQLKGWLHYELKDGTNGLMRPGKWRVAE